MKTDKILLILSAALLFSLGGLTQKYLGDPQVETKVVEVEVKNFPDDISLGFHNPVTNSKAAMQCGTSITGDVDMDLSIFTSDRVQGYGCIRIPVVDL